MVHIIAHAAGGHCLKEIMESHEDRFFNSVGKIAIVDSWVVSKENLNEGQQEFFQNNVVHYQASVEPMG